MESVLLVIITTFLLVIIWFLPALIGLLTQGVSKLGSYVHDLSASPTPEEKEAWLFSTLIGVTKWPSVIAGGLAIVTVIATLFVGQEWLLVVRNLLFELFLIILLARLLGVLVGSVMYGASLRTIIKSLQS